MTADEGLWLEHADGRRAAATLADVNNEFAKYGARVWPLDLSDVARDQRRLLDQPRLGAEDTEKLLERFLLPRERLLALITAAGREPSVPRGGEMDTLDSTHGVPYPELYLVAPGADYSRFDRLYVEDETS